VIVVVVVVAGVLVDCGCFVDAGTETVVVARTSLPGTYDAPGTYYVSAVTCCDDVGKPAKASDAAVEICGLSCVEMTSTCFSYTHNVNFSDIYIASHKIIVVTYSDNVGILAVTSDVAVQFCTLSCVETTSTCFSCADNDIYIVSCCDDYRL